MSKKKFNVSGRAKTRKRRWLTSAFGNLPRRKKKNLHHKLKFAALKERQKDESGAIKRLTSYLAGVRRGECFDRSRERDEENLVGSPRIDTEAEVASTEGGATWMTRVPCSQSGVTLVMLDQ